MRTALWLLFLLALAAVPGSLFPQRRTDPAAVNAFAVRHPAFAPWLDRLSMFDVFAAPWFAAIYLLLMMSLLGCLVPRTRRLVTTLRAAPVPVPTRLERLPSCTDWYTPTDPDGALTAAARELRRRRFRVRRDGDALSAEGGRLHDVGNLLFHLSLLLMFAAFAVGTVFGYHGVALVTEGDSFSNTAIDYDELTPGRAWRDASLPPFSFTLDKFTARFEEEGSQRGSPREFSAVVTYRASPTAAVATRTIRVNDPLVFGGTKVFLTGHGYAPEFTVRDGQGRIVYQGPVKFLPQDASLLSEGVVKVPDVEPDQLGFAGIFLPTAAVDPVRGPISTFPGILNPVVVFTVWHGDLGLDQGVPQSVWRLDTRALTQFRTPTGDPVAQALSLGETMTLPDGRGSITFDGVRSFASFQIASDPGKEMALIAAILALTGLCASLFVRRRRIFVRAITTPGTGSHVQIAALSKSTDPSLSTYLETIAKALQVSAPHDTSNGPSVPSMSPPTQESLP